MESIEDHQDGTADGDDHEQDSSMVKKLRRTRGQARAKFTRACKRADALMNVNGSRRLLQQLLGEIDAALDGVAEVTETYMAAIPEGDDNAKRETEAYLDDVNTKQQVITEKIEVHLSARKQEAPSVNSSRGSRSSQTSGSSTSANARVKAKVKALEFEQLQRRLELEEQQEQLKRQQKLQRAKDDADAAAYEAQLQGGVDDLHLERRQDFDDELPARRKIHAITPDEEQHDGTVPTGFHGNRDDNQVAGATRVRDWIDGLLVEQPLISPILTSRAGRTAFPKSIPKIELPKFKGDSAEWPRWIGLFKALIHDQPSLSETEKMTHLQSAVSGSARAVIAGMMFDGQLYSKALQALRNRYGREDDIACASLRSVFDHQPMKHHDVTALEAFQGTLHSTVISLESLGFHGDINSAENLRRVIQKLPMELKRDWGKYVLEVESIDQRRPSLLDFDEWMTRQVRISLNYSDFTKPGGCQSSKQGQGHSSNKQISTRKSTFVVKATTEPVPECPSCKKPHSLVKCPAFEEKTPDERAAYVAETGRCFACLEVGHRSRQCAKKENCEQDGCRGTHHVLLHGSRRIYSRRNGPTVAVSSQGPKLEENDRIVAAVPATDDKVTVLQIVPVRVHGPDHRYADTYALLDSGAQTSLCCQDLVKRLHISGEKKMLRLGTIEADGERRSSIKFKMELTPTASTAMKKKILVTEAWSVPKLNVYIPQISLKKKQAWRHIDGLDVPFITAGKVEVLLGANVTEAIIQLEVRRGKPGQPIAIRTEFGWSIIGSISRLAPPSMHQVFTVQKNVLEDDDLDSRIQNWWSTEAFGTKHNKLQSHSIEDARALKMLEENTKKINGRYETCLLWKSDHIHLPNNRMMAVRRLQNTEKSLRRNPEKAAAYSKTFDDYINKGFVRKLSKEEADVPCTKRWFLPHHAVENPNKKKIRVVFDATATFHDVSLNNQLLTGPDLLQSLPGILLRFREKPIALSADIEAMYHQVKVCERDQPAISFLWRGMDDSVPPDVYQMLVTVFGARCSPAMASFALRKTADDSPPSSEPQKMAAAAAIHSDFYMDDFVRSEDTVRDAISMQKEVTEMVANGGFRLTKWTSNSRKVLFQIPEAEVSCSTASLTTDDIPTVKTLGVLWNPEEDAIGFKIRESDVPATKRGVLSKMSAIFDPFGIAAPFVLQAKVLVQHLWSKQLDWDETLKEDDLITWNRWCQDLPNLQYIQIPRCLRCPDDQLVRRELHVFGDASAKAFGAVAYQRSTMEDGQLCCSFIMSRSRVAPLKKLSIVRLETQAAVLAVRLAETIRSEVSIPFDETMYWSDSQVVLCYIMNENRRFHVFIANRMAEIHDSTTPDQWRFVPGCQNPADVISRGAMAREITTHPSWLNGPAFLWSDVQEWPTTVVQDPLADDDPEVACAYFTKTIPVDVLPDPARWSSWIKYRRTVAWILRFLHNFKAKSSARSGLLKSHGPLRAAELKDADKLIFQMTQKEAFPEEYEACRREMHLSRHSKLLPLAPKLLDGLMKVGGRLKNAPIPSTAKHPILLPHDADVTRLLIIWCHLKVMHLGIDTTLNEVRQKFWFPKARSTVKKILYACSYCRWRRTKPQSTLMADLPAGRFDTLYVFSTCGLDYCGPFQVKKFRKTEKRYVLLVTCLASRALHLEVAYSLDTDSFLMAFRRFNARRGHPATVYSDNGTNLKSGERELREALQALGQQRIIDALSQHNITWIFNPPAASHMGGVWERLVASVKRCLKAVLGNQSVNDEVFHTVVTEVEAVLNSRPLTYVSGNPDEPEVLTPNHFLLGRASPNLPPGVFSDRDMTSRKYWRQAQLITNHFWKRWSREYVPQLISRSKWTRDQRNLKPDDVVLVAESNTPRGLWPLARIIKVFPGPDGRVRSVELKTKSGIYHRPVTKVCLLEEAKNVD